MLDLNPVIEDLSTVTGGYREILISSMNLIADRYERDLGYPWIDTKFNTITGEDFLKEDPLRSKGIVYSWIQGRGLESLMIHIEWILNNYTDSKTILLTKRLNRIVKEVAESVKTAVKLNGGHLSFFMNPLGKTLVQGIDGKMEEHVLTQKNPWNISDIFGSKGLFAASLISGNEIDRISSVEYIKKIVNGITHGNFITDQQPLAEKNPVTAVKGRLSHTPWMLIIGSLTLLLKHGVSEALSPGIRAIQYILDNHINIAGKWENLEENDYVEYIKTNGELWVSEGCVLSDPGHALEFVGLTSRFLSTALSLKTLENETKQVLSEISPYLFPIFQRNFTNGFNRKAEGITKLIDLISRQPVNRLMPWWSLPETMRAALGCYEIIQREEEREFCLEAYSLCHNSLMNNYIQTESSGLFSVQNRDENGRIIDSISAVPDADPGYHTGIALIDCLDMIESNTHRGTDTNE
ncbi:MAG: hypothetical protein DRP70_16065 [Spirochaetes bacterium]|nr:MAG: hypothetical protein DRP70_16065 [Spirochaetota bacterium]